IYYDNECTQGINLIGTKKNYRGNNISMIFQEPMTSLNPSKKCGEQVAEAIIQHKKCSRTEANLLTVKLLEKVKLPNPEKAFNAYPHELSGGQKQRIMTAMALSCNPAVLIADEPTTALDVTVQKSILELLKDLQKEFGMGIIFISHDLDVISEIADKVLVMYKGKIVEENSIDIIFSNAKHPYTRGLLACKPSAGVRLKKLPTINEFITLENDNKNDLIESEQEREDKHRIIYSKPPVLLIRDLKIDFVVKRSITGKPKKIYRAVNKVTFEVYENETLGVVGESGCGKTTLGRSILKLLNPSEGDIIYKGTSISKMDRDSLKAFRKDFQIIFQDPYSSLNPFISIGATIMEPMKVHNILKDSNERKEKVIYLLERVGLDGNCYNCYPHEFSGGQRQRICIARTLAMNPKFIICDESVSALDVSVQAQVLNLLNELKNDFNFTYIFISHDLSVVKFMSDRIIVMNKGSIEESGFADDIYTAPQSKYTKALISAIPGRKKCQYIN
ncbi:MAG: ABC transporter ATP-binding protein, partial [Bacteroidota bacterium]|nr:ABC transporter ATP-binding protein [Bacteroidota bacterium]